MARALAAPGARVQAAWRTLSPLPLGRWLFSRFVGWTAPYTRTVGGQVRELRPGFCRVELAERWSVRNHLNSVHAIALANVGEMSSGLAMMATMPAGVRGIPVRIEIDYLKKARGLLSAETTVALPPITAETTHPVTCEIYDASRTVVSRCTVTWRLSP
ncbi:MAG: hotdog fold domain-containing protein [Gemmatimonadaceae bacterium]|nr:hotdog fold domain-containing protein [Gemmatimonadaceae bacterium]